MLHVSKLWQELPSQHANKPWQRWPLHSLALLSENRPLQRLAGQRVCISAWLLSPPLPSSHPHQILHERRPSSGRSLSVLAALPPD